MDATNSTRQHKHIKQTNVRTHAWMSWKEEFIFTQLSSPCKLYVTLNDEKRLVLVRKVLKRCIVESVTSLRQLLWCIWTAAIMKFRCIVSRIQRRTRFGKFTGRKKACNRVFISIQLNSVHTYI